MVDAWLWRALATGLLVSVPCAVIGVFLYLRRMSLVADALAHVALPGIVVAFLVTGSSSVWPLLVGAIAVGVASTALMQGMSGAGVREDAAVGIVFTTLFSFGVILLSSSARDVDLDLDCVLFGDILGVSNASLALLGAVSVLVVALSVAFYRWLALSTFDATVAATCGVPVALVHHGLVGAASVTSVVSFEAVGAVLGVAMVIVPAASAHRVANRLPSMLAFAVAHNVVSTLVGIGASLVLDCSTAGAIVVASGALYALVFVAGPHHGVLAMRRAERGHPASRDPALPVPTP